MTVITYLILNLILKRVRAEVMASSPGAEGGPVRNHMSPNFDS